MDKTACYLIISLYAILIFTIFQIPCLAQRRRTNLTTDESSLLSLKAHLGLHPHHILERNWTNSSSVCIWIGVTCGLHHRRVTALNVSNMGLSGTIPPQLGNLSFIVSLHLGDNLFSGTLPQELSLLHRLKFISVRNNNLEGNIPESLSRLSNLQVLDLADNHLSGAIPSPVFNISTLNAIYLQWNELSGNLPNDICSNLPVLQVIRLPRNELSGEIPSNISQCSQLKILSLSFNSFSGQIPSALGKLHCLQYLYLGTNYLYGYIPQEIGNLYNLIWFAIEQNQISGKLPVNLFRNMSSLQTLSLWRNKLSGKLPRDIANLTMLTTLELAENNFSGAIPTEIGQQLHQLEELAMFSNALTGSIPPQLLNISTLVYLRLTDNDLSGNLPTNLCIGSPMLQSITLALNSLSGPIPHSISHFAHLKTLELSSNRFIGFVPHFLGNLTQLNSLRLANNALRLESSSLSFITALTKCRFLQEVIIGGNPLHGLIPHSIGNLSSSLQLFSASDCNLKGSISHEINNLINLTIFDLSSNELSGIIPPTFKNLLNLQGLYLRSNNLEGPIPDGLCDLHRLYDIELGRNKLSGPIPECLGNVSSLRLIHLDSNMLTSTLPFSLWHLKDLLTLDLSSNSFTGFLPLGMGDLRAANYINLSMNNLSGSIPNTMGNLQTLVNLSLAHNRLDGSIPESMGSMLNLATLDFSYNNLSGSIPKSLEKLGHLALCNLSFNSLSGEIPSGGPFANFTMDSFKGNEALCGLPKFHVPPCPANSNHRSKRKKLQISLFALAGVGMLITVASLAFILSRHRKKDRKESGDDVMMSTAPERISYYQILQATEQFNESNLLGSGSCGSVYRGILRDGMAIAVKVFNLESEAAFKSFDVECEVLRNIRHRNLTKVISSCSNPDFRALVLEYMPGGNLDKWLYSHNYWLDAMQRLNIMIDVASALEYLHHGCSVPIVHCDLKPSNVLLDEEMNAHVTDFGIAKLFGYGESTVLTNTLATFGYIAPEYGLEGLVSTRCDVYSYGVMLMETFTRKKPSDDMFTGDLSLRSWVERSVEESSDEVIDVNLVMNVEETHSPKMAQCLISVLGLGLRCSVESPGERINMKEALVELHKIKRRLIE